MIYFTSKISVNKIHGQYMIYIPSFVFKQKFVEFDENAEYDIKINEISFTVSLSYSKSNNQKSFTIPSEYREKFKEGIEYKIEISKKESKRGI